MKQTFKRSVIYFLPFLLSLVSAVDLFVPNFDPIILKNLNIEYEWFENLLEVNTKESDCLQINAQLPQIEFAYNTISNFQLTSGEETMKDLDNIRKLMGSLEIALDQEYEEKIFNESQFTEELSNVQRELKKKIVAQVLNTNSSLVEVIQWTNDLNETQYLSKISEESYLLSIKKEILNAQINENSDNQVLLIKDANSTISKLMILLQNYFELYYKSQKLNQQMILIFELNQYISENLMTQFDTKKLEVSYNSLKIEFQEIYSQIQQIQKLYQKMKNLLNQMLKKIEAISEEKEITVNEQTNINDMIQKYQILSSIFQGIQQQEESNKTLSQLIQKQEYLMNYQETLKNLDEMYTFQLNEAANELQNIENTSYMYALRQDTIQEIIEQQNNLKIQMNQIEEEQTNITNQISLMQQKKEQIVVTQNQLEQEQIQTSKSIEQLELNISKIQNWLHNSLKQIQNYTEIKIAYQNKLETLRNSNKKDEIKNAEYNIKVISDWLPEQQKKYLQYQQYEENLFQELNKLETRKKEIQEKLSQYEIEEESSKLQFYSFVESQASFVYNNNPSELESLLYKSQKTMNELNKLKQGQSLLLQEYEKLVKEKEQSASISTQFQNFLEMKGFDSYSTSFDPEYKAIIQSDEFKAYQQAQESNFIQKQNELMEQQSILAKLNSDIAAKEDELQTISINVDACVIVCSVVGHKSHGSQLSLAGSKLSSNPKDDVSSNIKGSIKAKISMKENYVAGKPEVYGKQFGKQEDEDSKKSLIEKIDVINEKAKIDEKENWSSTKQSGKFYSNISSALVIFIDPLQNNITTMIHIEYEITSNISTKVIIFEDIVDRKSNKQAYSFSDQVSEEHKDIEDYDIHHSKAKHFDSERVSSIVKITWTNVIGAIMEGAPEDEVSSKIVLDGKIQTTFKSYSGKIQDEKEIQAVHNFEDNVSSKIFSIQKQNEISHKENYIKNAIAIAEATYGLIQEAISIRQQGKIKNSAYSSISAPQKDQVSSRAIYKAKDLYSQEIQKVAKDRKIKKTKAKFIDQQAIRTTTQFRDQVSSKAHPKQHDQMDNEQTWKKHPDLVSSKAIKPKSTHFIKARYYVPKDSVSSKVVSKEGTIVHVHKFLHAQDHISEGKKLLAISKYAIRKKSTFKNSMAIKAAWKKQADSVSSRIIEQEVDEVSSKNHTTFIDTVHHNIIASLQDDVSSIVHATSKSIYAIKKHFSIKDQVSSRAIQSKQDYYASKHKYQLIDKIKIKGKYNQKDIVSSKIYGKMQSKIAIKATAQFQDEVSSTIIGKMQAIIGAILSTDDIEDQVSSNIIANNQIQASHKGYSGALVDEVAGQTTFVNYIWFTSHISFIDFPHNNITTKIIIYAGGLTNVTTAIHKFVEIQNNISTDITFFESIGNNITTMVKMFVDLEDEVSSKALVQKDQIAYKHKFFVKDSVSSRVHQTLKDEVSSTVFNGMSTLISGKALKKIQEKISEKKLLSLEDKFAIKAHSPKVSERYSGKQTEWPRQHTYSGIISKCDCYDDVSSILEGFKLHDYYSKAKMEQITNIVSAAHQFSYQNLIGIQFAGAFIDEVSSQAVYKLTDKISGDKKLADLMFIGSKASTEEFEDEVSSHIHKSTFIQTSAKSYSGKIEDYHDIKSNTNFKDYVSSKINALEPVDSYFRKILLKSTDKIGSKTSWKKQSNITTSIVFFADLKNNITTHITDNAEFHNISTAIKIFQIISNQISTHIIFITQPEDEVSSITHDRSVSIYADIISWIEFEDEVSSKVYPGTQNDNISSIVHAQPQDETSHDQNCQLLDKFAFKAQHQFIEEIHQKYSGKLINKAYAKTSFTYYSNISTHIHIFKPAETSNITTHIIKFIELANNVSTEIVEHKPLDIHNISTSITEVQDFNNVTSNLVKFVSLKTNNITSKLIIFEELGNMVSTGFYGSVEDQFTHKLYDGGIEADEKSSKTSCQLFDNITTQVVLFGEIQNYITSKLVVFSFENLAASKTSYKKPANNLTTSIIFFEKISNNVTSQITDFTLYNNISSILKIFVDAQNNISSHRIDFVPIEDEVHSKAIENLITIVSSIISELELEDEVSSKFYSSEKDRLSVKDKIPIPLDNIHAKTNALNLNKTARQSLVDYWLCDYVGEVFSYVAHKSTANVAGLSQYSNEMNSNALINTARHLALLLKNATYEKAKLRPSNNVDQLLQLTNSYQQMNGLNIHYYTQLRELLKAVKTEINYFYLVLEKQQQLYQKRNAYKNLIENLSKQKDKCMIKRKPKSNLRRRSDV